MAQNKEDWEDVPVNDWQDIPVPAAPTKSIVESAKETLGGYNAGVEEATPFGGLIDKGVAAAAAGTQEIGDLFRVPENQRDFSDRYQKGVEYLNRDRAQRSEAAPVAAAIGEGVGTAQTLVTPIPGGQMTGVAGAIARPVAAAGLAAVDAGTRGEEQLFDPEAARQAATTAGILGAGGEAVASVGKLIPGTVNAIKSIPEKVNNYFDVNKAERALKASGVENISSLRKYAGVPSGGKFDPERIDALRAKDAVPLLQSEESARPVLGWFTKTEDISRDLTARRKAAGEQIGSVGRKIDEALPEGVGDAVDLATALHSYADSIPTTGGGKSVAGMVKREADEILRLPRNLSFEQLQSMKNSYKYNPQAADSITSNKDATNYIKTLIGKKMDEAAEKSSAVLPGISEEYGQAKGKYGTYERLSTAASNSAEAAKARRMFSPSDYGVAAAAGGVSAINSDPERWPEAVVKGVAAGAAHKFVRERGPAFTAKAYDKMAGALSSGTNAMGKFTGILTKAASQGNAALAATHAMLMNDPEYRARLGAGSEESP